MSYAPIIIFVYRRSIDELINSLLKNELACESDVFIFSDGYKNNTDKEDVLEIRKSLQNIFGFKSVTIYESIQNKGLANSVISGVTEIINKYEKVIVLEDDLVVAENFLYFMNESLDFFHSEQNIWSISGYTPYLKCLNNYDKDIFLSLRANSWGWSTWKNRWDKIDWTISNWDSFKKNKKAIKNFNQAGNDMFKMLETQMLGKIDSWAIRWCYNQFLNNSYTVYPTQSKIQNNGFDFKGTHNSNGADRWDTIISNENIKLENITPNKDVMECFAKKYNMKFKTRLSYLLKKYGGYKIVKTLLK